MPRAAEEREPLTVSSIEMSGLSSSTFHGSRANSAGPGRSRAKSAGSGPGEAAALRRSALFAGCTLPSQSLDLREKARGTDAVYIFRTQFAP